MKNLMIGMMATMFLLVSPVGAQDNGGGSPGTCKLCNTGSVSSSGCCTTGTNGGTSCTATVSVTGKWSCTLFSCTWIHNCDNCQVLGECHIVVS